MTDAEQSSSKTDNDVICLSDDDDDYLPDVIKVNKNVHRSTNQSYFTNVYENSERPDHSKTPNLNVQNVKDKQKQNKQNEKKNGKDRKNENVKVLNRLQVQQQQQEQNQEPPMENDVVYVPDDNEEQNLLIGPVRQISQEIVFGSNISKQPTTFPYHCLLALEQHMKTAMRNVSTTTELNVWRYTVEQLVLIRLAYVRIIDVSKTNFSRPFPGFPFSIQFHIKFEFIFFSFITVKK